MTALRAEWIKLRTVPSTGWALAALLAGTVLFTALVCATASSGGCAPDTCHDYVVDNSLNGVFVGQIAVVALGVLAIGSEYSTGMIRVTFAAEPRRRRVLARQGARRRRAGLRGRAGHGPPGVQRGAMRC